MFGIAVCPINLTVLHAWESESHFETYGWVFISYHKHCTLVVYQVLLEESFGHRMFGCSSRFFDKLRVAEWSLLPKEWHAHSLLTKVNCAAQNYNVVLAWFYFHRVRQNSVCKLVAVQRQRKLLDRRIVTLISSVDVAVESLCVVNTRNSEKVMTVFRIVLTVVRSLGSW